ncbi:SDR family oxidoreductase [Opitutaceae bacterium TAV4]|nr:SDR family oxidoreductase [Opitutaceae bacterium TAV4]RRJ94500.1 SDR family oxidoreductase [Opitutaceae bacterium TAV4]RRJ98561.1 SDR family oxidoreductase [Opitutaceae bacterium TAV3]
MRIIVIGASGLVGSHVLAEAKRRGCETLGTYRNFPVEGLARLDLEDEGRARVLLEDFHPDWVVHAAGWTWVDGCEKDPKRAFKENCHQPEMLARICQEIGCRFVYFSTTYVFDGKAGPYSEDAIPNPINVYAQSKWAAEQKIQATLGGQALIPRVICVWGREAQKKNFVYQAIKALQGGRVMTLPSDQIGNPTWAGDIAWWLLSLIESNEHGVWNLAGDQEHCTRVDWFCQIRDAARAAGFAPAQTDAGYVAVDTTSLKQVALRPLHAGARLKKLRGALDREPVLPSALQYLQEVRR